MSLQTLSKRQEKTRLAFMTAFLRLIAVHGMDRISVTDIANEADYGRWTFYQYFESKEDVAWATFVHWMTELDNFLVAAVRHLESPRREYESWRLIFRAFYEQRDFFLKLDSTGFTIWRFRMKEFLVEQFLEHLKRGNFALMDGVRPEIAARLYVVAIIELLEYWGRNPSLGSSDEMVDEFFTFIFNQSPPK
jgi:AcrR family transcriptional regulator